DDHAMAARLVERGGQRGLVTGVAGQGDGDDLWIFAGRGREDPERPVRAAVVDEYDFVRTARYAVEYAPKTVQQLSNSSLLVVERNRNRQPHRAAHAERRPLK